MRFLWLACVALFLVGVVGCGGGGGDSGPIIAPPAVTVTVTPNPISLTVGQTQTFNAAVAGSSNTAVTWSVQEGAAGGAITAAGLYTAPAGAGTYHVIATSQANVSASGNATITVTAPAQVGNIQGTIQ